MSATYVPPPIPLWAQGAGKHFFQPVKICQGNKGWWKFEERTNEELEENFALVREAAKKLFFSDPASIRCNPATFSIQCAKNELL